MSLPVRLLDIGLVLAVVTNLAALTDFLLLPEQRARFNRMCDTLTLRLSFINTATWLRRWMVASRRANITLIVFLAYAACALPAVTYDYAVEAFAGGFSWRALARVAGFCAFMAGILAYFAVVVIKVSRVILPRLAANPSVLRFVTRFLASAAAGIAIIFALAFPLAWFQDSSANRGLLHLVLVLLIITVGGLMMTWICLFIDGLITLGVALIVAFPVRTIIRLAQAIMWRISSYPKGPLSAVLAVMTAVLGVVRYLIR
jgi:hypothetical protein